MKVFILDDNKDVSYAMEKARLRRKRSRDSTDDNSGVTVSIARDVRTARDIIRLSKKFDVWVIDHQLSYGEPTGLSLIHI